MGVWIEIRTTFSESPTSLVAPFVGVWIEIFAGFVKTCVDFVAPFVGVWIEITHMNTFSRTEAGRSLRGSVD